MSSAKGRAISLIERAEFWRINNQARMNNGTGLIANTYAPEGEIIPPAAAVKLHPSRCLTTGKEPIAQKNRHTVFYFWKFRRLPAHKISAAFFVFYEIAPKKQQAT